ncbi:rRNA methylase [Bellilinea caldifistulae]|uniref:rRNA methyltransferase n=1 Tax=Bellilinea caldifistulae TaxID=360411 RepID=A0A0P6XRH1_9CHLR|nr:RNA methyltransferase [Bellilinea caldifistulae]KPL74991.1 rRNA methyltransferase [Bellilinea caldifistulae]GAP10633.1 rRNA methylase [Bellilinea caldifistulae]
MITSPSNPTIKQIRKLRERKERQRSGLFFVEGLRIVGEALASNWSIEYLIYCPSLLNSLFGLQLVEKFQANGGNILSVSEEVFVSISSKDGPQGIAAVIHQQWVDLDKTVPREDEIWVALDSIADPGNLGTILRTNDAAGVKGVILLDQCTDPYDPASIRASMGAVFNQALIRATFQQFAFWKRNHSIPVIGTSDRANQDYHFFEYPQRLVLLMGSERQGLQEKHFAICDESVAIPMRGKSDSLNLAIATALCVYEIFNQRRENPYKREGVENP